MSERLLEAFREEAEHSIPLPDFDLISAAGRDRRRRRHAVVAAVTACVLGASGLLAATYGDRADPQPAGESDGASLVTPFPVGSMTTLEEGTYELDPFKTSRPSVRFTVPDGWNSWVGPNRFEGLSDGTSNQVGSNEDVLERGPDWVLGMLAVDVYWLAQPGCTMTEMSRGDSTTLVEALTDVPGLKVVSGPERGVRFGHPVVHLRLREQGGAGGCPNQAYLNPSEPASASVTYLGRGTTYDAWVVDLEGRALLIWAAWTRDTPEEEVDDLLRIVDSVELVRPDPS
jgi:hypothetical protein